MSRHEKRGVKREEKKKRRAQSDSKEHEGGADFNARAPKRNRADGSPAESDSRSRRAQFKATLRARKASKPDWQLIEEAKRVYNAVKSNDDELVTGGSREELVNGLVKMIRGRAAKLIFKHDASRIIQTCVKHGTEEQRQEIIEELKGHLLPLLKSKYGKFLGTKLFMYGNKQQRLFLMKQLRGHCRKLLTQKDAASVLEYAYFEVFDAKQKKRLLTEIYAPEMALLPDFTTTSLADLLAQEARKRDRILNDVETLISTWVKKEMLDNNLVQKVVYDYALACSPARRKALVKQLAPLTLVFMHTKFGGRLAAFIASYGSAKDRKAMCKSYKKHVPEIASDANGSLVLIRLLDVTDDTKLLAKSIIAPLVEDAKRLETLCVQREASSVLLHVLAPREPQYFPQFVREELLAEAYHEDGVTPQPEQKTRTSKKDRELRERELLLVLSKPLCGTLDKICNETTIDKDYGEERLLNNKNGSRVLFEAICKCGEEGAKLLSTLKNVVCEEERALGLFHLSRLVKRLIKSAAEGSVTQQFPAQLWQKLNSKGEERVLELANARGSAFVVLALLECPSTAKDVAKVLKPMKSRINNGAGGKLIKKQL